jgi:type I restriction-modification system DNA methylase subunit
MNNHINSANLGFEKEIFSAADKLRGNIDAAEYKNVVLGLIFLKYISDSFEDRYQELVDEGEGFEEDRDEYLAENIFFVPKEARWDFIASKAMTPEIGQVIDKAMVSIEEENDRLNGILPKNYARPELDKRRLGEVVVLFNNLKLKEHGDSKDILGRTYEYALAQFASLEGKNAGEFYTPSSVVRTLVEILQPYEGRVYDPCCGAGGMFVQSAKFVENHQRRVSELSIFGQESNANTWKLAQMNLAIHALEGEVPQYYVENSHPAIISPEVFDMVQVEIKRRRSSGQRQSGGSCFSSKIVCGQCGGFYGSKVWHSKSKYRRTIWQCNNKFKNGTRCETPHLYETALEQAFVGAFNDLIENKSGIIQGYESIIHALTDNASLEAESTKLQSECDVVLELMRKCVDENAHSAMDQGEYQERYNGLVERYETAKKRLDEISDEKQVRAAKRESISQFLADLKQRDGIVETFDEELWYAIVDSVTVDSAGNLTFSFKNGMEIKVQR